MEEQPVSVRPLPPGATIGPYTILRQIPGGVGGMAVVYEARLENRRESVALKVAHAGLGSFLKDEAAFLKALQLNHPHIIRVLPTPLGGGVKDYIVKDPESGCWYFAMEYMAGGSLADWLARRRRIPIPKAVEVVRQIGSALDVAHQAGILHLDVKPSNILFRENPERRKLHAVLTDFGIARPVGRAATAQTTLTVEYASPEQVRRATGEPVEVGPASDLYSLGVVFYEAVTGRLPFRGEDDLTLLHQILHEEPDLSAPLPPALVPILRRALSKDPATRYPSAAAFAADLEQTGAGEISAGKAPPLGRRAWAPLALGLALGFLLGFPSGWYLGQQGEETGSPSRPEVGLPTSAAPSRLTLLPTPTVPPSPSVVWTPTRLPTSTPIPPTPTLVPRPPTSTPVGGG
ncbi:MAG: serine/threonine-protein kinase [Anaerolineae bacterium]|nr:serine/threonine protein kinase [Anaerolineae bacterium]MDW7990872.1 serine/threonine-protein kinase [Anaerolineae bacterium]